MSRNKKIKQQKLEQGKRLRDLTEQEYEKVKLDIKYQAHILEYNLLSKQKKSSFNTKRLEELEDFFKKIEKKFKSKL